MPDNQHEAENDAVDSNSEEDTQEDEVDTSEDEADESQEDSEDDSDQSDDYEPPVRGEKPWKTKEERAEFFKNKKNDKPNKNQGDDDDLEKRILAGVQKVLDPVLQTIADREDEREIREFLSKPEHAKFKKHEAKVRKEMKVYKNVPISVLFRNHAYDDAKVEGAEQADKAKEKNARRQAGGSGTRQTQSSVPDFSKMTPEQLRKFNSEVKAGKKVKVEE